MQYNTLGKTGLSVSRLCLGAMTFGPGFYGIGQVIQELADRVSSVIVGAKKMKQLEDNLGAVGVSFTEEELDRLDALTKPAPRYPQWMIQRQNQGERQRGRIAPRQEARTASPVMSS